VKNEEEREKEERGRVMKREWGETRGSQRLCAYLTIVCADH
jgi:hypothetical protein